MLFPGGTLGPVGTLLIGLTITAATTLAGIIAAMPKKRWNLISHLLLATAYLSLTAVIVDLLPVSATGAGAGALLILFLALPLTGTIHFALVIACRKKEVQVQSTTAALKDPSFPGAVSAFVLINSSNESYQKAVVALENRGTEFSYVQYRIAPYFLRPFLRETWTLSRRWGELIDVFAR
jgi:hypothetical protein